MAVKLVSVVVPSDDAQRIERLLRSLTDVHHLHSFPGHNCVEFRFNCKEKKAELILQELYRAGVGTPPQDGAMDADTDFDSIHEHVGTIDIINVQMTQPKIGKDRWRTKKLYRMDDRMSYDEIFQFVDSQSHLTFDYIALISIAAIISGVGLLTASSVLVVASMLVAPLMGPILGLTLGYLDNRRSLLWKGFRNESIGLLLTFFWGIVQAICVIPFWENYQSILTMQITSRGNMEALVSGVFVAIPSGAGVAISVTSGGIAALVGVAISASLLPPIVNSGITLTFGLWLWWTGDPSANMHLSIAAYSMLLFFINWACIFVFAVIFFKIKKVHRSGIIEFVNEFPNRFKSYNGGDETDDGYSASHGLPGINGAAGAVSLPLVADSKYYES